MSLADFFAMGGYGFYVWGSYVMAVVLVAIWWNRRPAASTSKTESTVSTRHASSIELISRSTRNLRAPANH